MEEEQKGCLGGRVSGLQRGFHWGDTTPMRSEPNHIRH